MSSSFFVRGRCSARPELEQGGSARRAPVRLGEQDPTQVEPSPEDRAPYVILGAGDPDGTPDERVFRARDVDLGREIELRVLVVSGAATGERARSFADECLLAAQVQHPCARTIYEVGETREGELYFAAELIDALSLRQLLQGEVDRPFCSATAMPILELVAQGLAAAHRRGIAHGDLTAERVRVGRFGEVKVLGWEHGRRFDPTGSDGRLEAEDLCAWGRMLAEVLAAERRGAREEQRAAREPELEALVARCTGDADGGVSRVPRLTAQTCAEELAAWIARAERRARESELGAERATVVARGARRRRILGTAIGIAILCSIVGGGLAWSAWISAGRESEAQARRDVEPRLREALALVAKARAGSAGELEPWIQAAAVVSATIELAHARRTPLELLRELELLEREVEASSSAAQTAHARREAWLRQVAELSRLRRECARTWDFTYADRRYEAIFTQLGCGRDVPFETRVERLRASGVVDELVAALDAWWDFRRMISSQQAGELLRLAIAVDTDPLRQTLRRALETRETLVEFAHSRDLDRLDPTTWILLSHALYVHGESALGSMMLERACALHPTDLWLHIDLSAAAIDDIEPKRPALALRHAWAAVALDPRSSGALNRLALAWVENGDPERAVDVLQRAQDDGDRSHGTSVNLTLALHRAGEYLGAIHVAEEALARFPQSVELRVNCAMSLDELNRHDEAMHLVREALELDPRHIRARSALGVQLCQRLRRFDESEEVFLSILSDDPRQWMAYLNLAVVAQRRGEDEASLQWARRGLEVAEAADLHALIGKTLSRLGRNDEAVPHLERAIEGTNRQVGAINLLAEIHLGRNRAADARALLERGILSDQPQSMWSYLRLAELLQLEGDGDRAMAIAEQGLERFPKFAGLHRVRGSLFESYRRQPDRAFDSYLRGASAEGNVPTVDQLGCILMAGGVLIDLKQIAWAHALFDRAELHPFCDARFAALLGRSRYAAGDEAGAERALRRAVEGRCDDPDAWKQLGRIYAQSDRIEELEALAEQVLAQFSRDASVAGYWGYLLVTTASPRPERAEALLAHAVGLQPKQGEPWYYLGVARSQQGRYAEAIAAWEQALALRVRGVETFTNIGFAHYRLGRHALASHWFERALQERGQHGTALYDLGLVLWELGELEAAGQSLERAVECEPGVGAIQITLAQIALELGDFERARDAFARAEELGLAASLGAELERDRAELEALERWSEIWSRVLSDRASWPQAAGERARLAKLALLRKESGIALELLRLALAEPPAGVHPNVLRFRAARAACDLANRSAAAEERAALYGEVLAWLSADLDALEGERPVSARLAIERRLRNESLGFLRDPELLAAIAPEHLSAARALAQRYAEALAALRERLGDVLPSDSSK
jgi:tetratricopeptide (TPR) repeat protein